MDITYATLCSGIECAGLAADPLGWTQMFNAEIDPFACAVLAHRRPDVPNMGDMTTLAERVRQFGYIFPDVIIAGSPCQSFSIAGMQRSLDDARGNLTLELVRVLDAVDDAREKAGMGCCTLVWENVPGVLSTKDNAFGCFLAALVGADEPIAPFGDKDRWPRAGMVRGPRRQVAWRILDAQWFGVAQRRRRVFLVAGAGDGFDPSAVLFEPDGVSRNPPSRREARQEVARPLAGGARGGSGYRNDADTAENLIPSILRGISDYGGDVADDVAPTLRSMQFDASHANAGGQVAIAFDSRQDTVSSEEVFGALGSSSPQAQAVAYFLHANKGRPAGRSSAHTDMVTVETEVVPTIATDGHAQSAVAFHQNERSEVRLTDVFGALSTGGEKPGQGYPALYAPPLTVRRLTPLECERLQGLPDGWTDIPYRGKPASDGPRYRAIGNGMAVPCVAWILERLDRHLKGALL